MTQRASRLGSRVRALARRYGWETRTEVALALGALVLVAGVWGVRAFAAPQALTIERGSAAAVDGDEAAEAGPEQAEAAPRIIVVHIDGGVAHPGVYEFGEESPRINDAVDRAGGLLETADTSAVNLAAPLLDGAKVHIPVEGEDPVAEEQPASAAASPAVADASSDPGQGASGLVNINTADATELQSLPGVGEATAAAIVDDRQRSGPFSAPEDLMRVSGIGEKKFAKLQGLICV